MKLILDFNEALNQVKVRLEGGGTLFIDKLKHEHKDALVYELVNLVLYHFPDSLEFIGVKNEQLIQVLESNNIEFDSVSKKLTYKH